MSVCAFVCGGVKMEVSRSVYLVVADWLPKFSD